MTTVQTLSTADADFETRAADILSAVGLETKYELSHVLWIQEDDLAIAALAVEENNRIIGLMVREGHRRMGHAKALLKTFMESRAGKILTAEVDLEDEWVYAWFKRLGFVSHDHSCGTASMSAAMPTKASLYEGIRVYTHGNNTFYADAAEAVRELYAAEFGTQEELTPERIQSDQVVRVLCIEDTTEKVVAATMVAKCAYNYHVQGIACSVKRKGHGTRLMRALVDMCRDHDLRLGVDTGKENTEFLIRWYEKLGFHVEAEQDDSTQTFMCRPAAPWVWD